jgi:MSHA biogenesis protein MshQ
VIAINSGAINTTYNKQVTVDLIDGTAASCSSATALAGTTVTTSPYTYDMTDNGVHTFTFTSTNAYSNVQVRIKDNTSTDCTSDHFSIRPSTFTITSTDAGNNAASGNPMIKAGAVFNLTATALAGYDGTPLIDNAKVIGSPTAGTLSGSFAAAAVATGIATPATGSFTYSEVGNFGLSQNAVYDASFTTIDQGSGDCVATDPSGTGANFSNTLDANGQYGCYIGSVAVAQTTGSSGFGRFIPDHFDTLINLVLGVPMPCGAGLTCPTTYHGMVYEKQPFSLTVTAMNASGVVTTNYNTTSGYSKTVTLSAYDALGGGALLANGALGITSVTAFGSGTITELNEKYTFAAVPTTPTNIYIRASDSDGASSLRTTALNSIEGGVAVVSGRTSISNANGSELLPLQMTATVQFYNAAGSWVTSTTDSLSSYSTVSNLLASIVTPPATTLTAGQISAKNAGTVTMGGGVSKFTLNAPGVSGKASISLSAPSYLPSTAGIATFGIFPGRKEIIYMRENY